MTGLDAKSGDIAREWGVAGVVVVVLESNESLVGTGQMGGLNNAEGAVVDNIPGETWQIVYRRGLTVVALILLVSSSEAYSTSVSHSVSIADAIESVSESRECITSFSAARKSRSVTSFTHGSGISVITRDSGFLRCG